MSKRKPKTATIWFRFTFLDTAPARARVMRAADKLFAVSGVEDRRTYSEEDVVRMVKEALKEARCRGQLVFTHADLDAAMRDGATIETESDNIGGMARVKIIWPESTGFLLDNEEPDNDPDA